MAYWLKYPFLMVLCLLISMLIFVTNSPAQSPGYAVSVSPATVASGGTVAVSWQALSTHSNKDWIGVFIVGTPSNAATTLAWKYVPTGTTGTMIFPAPSVYVPGVYEFRYFVNDSFNRTATSRPITVVRASTSPAPAPPSPAPSTTTSPAPVPASPPATVPPPVPFSPPSTSPSPSNMGYAVTASPISTVPGVSITVAWQAPSNHSSKDWIGLFITGNPSNAATNLAWKYVSAGSAGSTTFAAPKTLIGHAYQFRYFLNDKFTEVARSNPVTVSQPTSNTLPPPPPPAPIHITPTVTPVPVSPAPSTSPPPPPVNPVSSPSSGPCPNGKQIAFPGAEGFGRCAQGGRGGVVVEVTNLDDAGPGSLRDCAEAMSGPRTCLIKVNGLLQLTTALPGENPPSITPVHPYVTIDGSQAPGFAISGRIWLKTDHVIMRHVRIRPGWKLYNDWCMGIGGNDIIVDHLSCTWSTDEGIWIGGESNITIQHSIVAEGIQDGSTGERRQSKGINLGGGVHRVTLYKNYMALNGARNPIIGVTKVDGVDQHRYDIVNNVVLYENQGNAADQWTGKGPSHANWVGNLYVQMSQHVWYQWAPLRVMGNLPYSSQSGLYVKGNISQERPSNDRSEEDFVWFDNGSFPVSQTRYPAPPLAGETDAFTAYSQVLASNGVGALPRDAIDQRIVNCIKTATVQPGTITRAATGPGCKIITHENEVGGYRAYSAGTASGQ